MKKVKYDFGGYATRNDLKCSDGRTIRKDAFKENDGDTVPLVWHHMHNDPANILGHAVLENREDGVYVYGKFNNTESGINAKALVEHGDINRLSIHANGLVQKGKDVIHGSIREVSLVLAGANPGAFIDNIAIEHSDGSYTEDTSEAVISSGLELDFEDLEMFHEDEPAKKSEDKTVADVFNSLSEEQKNVVYFMIGQALEAGDVEHSDDDYFYQGGERMKVNVFDKTDKENRETLSHSQIEAIISDAQKCGSLKESFLAHAEEYGIENIDYLFPDAKTVTPTPEMITRDMAWVRGVIDGAKHTPFSRIKSTAADITAEEARAKGYIKGNLKKEEVIKLLKRVTTPTTIYKKQKLDRDDVIDITDLDVIAWLKAEMRLMLDEEIARAVLIGDGREVEDPDKINEENIRPIAKDNELYAHPVNLAPNLSGNSLVEAILRARKNYKGTGSPTLYTTEDIITDLLLIKDKIGRRLYPTEAELASALRVKSIVAVEAMETMPNLLGILVNINDYTIGADKGGQVSMFDDFDIDYNQYKYLIETRISGCLTKPKSALVFWRGQGIKATPVEPTFNDVTGLITIPTVTGVVYLVDGDPVTEDVQLVAGQTAVVTVEPDEGYYFAANITTSWEYTFGEEEEEE